MAGREGRRVTPLEAEHIPTLYPPGLSRGLAGPGWEGEQAVRALTLLALPRPLPSSQGHEKEEERRVATSLWELELTLRVDFES